MFAPVLLLQRAAWPNVPVRRLQRRARIAGEIHWPRCGEALQRCPWAGQSRQLCPLAQGQEIAKLNRLRLPRGVQPLQVSILPAERLQSPAPLESHLTFLSPALRRVLLRTSVPQCRLREPGPATPLPASARP